MAWTSLPNGQALNLVPGYIYAASASVKTSHTTQDIQNLAAGQGLTVLNLEDPAVIQGQTAASGYRFIGITVQATKSGSLPWSVPWWLPGDSSTILQAWVEPSPSGPPGLPPVPPTIPSPSPWPWVLALGGLGVLGWVAWKRRRP